MAISLCKQLTNRTYPLRPWLWVGNARRLSVCSACRTQCAPAYLISMASSRQTAAVHAAAWKEMFDAYLRERSERTGELFMAFERVTDYDTYVDGKPRADGTRSFLQSRGIALPEGNADDEPEAETVHGLGNRKNEIVLRRLREAGVRCSPAP